MIEIQTGLLKEEHIFIVGGKEYYNSKLYAKDGYHFYNIKEYKELILYIEEEKQKRKAIGEDIENLQAEKNFMTFIITPLTNNKEINEQFISEPIEKI